MTPQEIRWGKIFRDSKATCALVQEIASKRGPKVERQHPVRLGGRLMFAPLMIPELSLVVDTYTTRPDLVRASHFSEAGLKVEFHNEAHSAETIWAKLARHHTRSR